MPCFGPWDTSGAVPMGPLRGAKVPGFRSFSSACGRVDNWLCAPLYWNVGFVTSRAGLTQILVAGKIQ